MKQATFSVFLAVAAIVLQVGCGTPAHRIERNPARVSAVAPNPYANLAPIVDANSYVAPTSAVDVDSYTPRMPVFDTTPPLVYPPIVDRLQ